jgi:hypothetical protein
MKASIAGPIPEALRQEHLNGRLFNGFRGSDAGSLPGEKRVFLPWQHFHSHMADTLAGSRRVAIWYSPNQFHSPHFAGPRPCRKGQPIETHGTNIPSL